MKLGELINSYYNHLNENDMHVLRFVLNNKEQSSHMGINELAEACNTSSSSVHRLTKKLGFSGYSEFRVFLKWEEPLEKSEMSHIQRLETDTAATIKNLATIDFSPIVRQLAVAQRIFIYGSGTAQLACANEAQRMFAVVHTFVTVIHDSVQFETVFPAISEKDVVIIISLSGDTPALLPQAKQLKARGIPFISITNLKNNQLAQIAPYTIYAASTPTTTSKGVQIVSFVPFYIAIETLFRHYTEKIDK